jgi:hypothetical protein
VTLADRLALAAFIGDGHTTTALGREGAVDDDVARLRPHVLRVAGEWVEQACAHQGPRWPAGLDRRAAGRRVRERIGDRCRWVETDGPVDAATTTAIASSGATVIADNQSAENRGSKAS